MDSTSRLPEFLFLICCVSVNGQHAHLTSMMYRQHLIYFCAAIGCLFAITATSSFSQSTQEVPVAVQKPSLSDPTQASELPVPPTAEEAKSPNKRSPDPISYEQLDLSTLPTELQNEARQETNNNNRPDSQRPPQPPINRFPQGRRVTAGFLPWYTPQISRQSTGSSPRTTDRTLYPRPTPPTGSGTIAAQSTPNIGCPCGCQPQCTTKTIMVPQWETRYTNVIETRYRQEVRQKKFQTYHTVYDEVPKIQHYTVPIPEQRSRKYTVNRTEEYQVPVQENFTVMVPRPRQREVTVDREESYRVPVEVPYTVNVPMKREIQETTYKEVVDKEPYQERYTIQVPVERVRLVTDYKKVPVVKTIRKPVVRMVEQELVRAKVDYKTEIRERQVEEKYIVYQKRDIERDVVRYRMVERTQQVDETYFDYEPRSTSYQHVETAQIARPIDKTIDYKVTVPFTEDVQQTYYVNEAYPEQVTKTFPVKIQTPREVTKTYNVTLPYIEHVKKTFSINIPVQQIKTSYRTITRQIPITKFRTITRDMGYWSTEVISTPSCELFQDQNGCPTYCPTMQTCHRNIWCPNLVTERVPYTAYQDVPFQISYRVPVIVNRRENRTKLVPITRYRTETRTAKLKVLDFKNSQRTETFTVTKYRWKPQSRTVTLDRARTETRQKTIPFVEFETRSNAKNVPYQYKELVEKTRRINETFLEKQPYTVKEKITITEPVEKTRMVTQQFTVRVPIYKNNNETYRVKLPQMDYEEIQETVYVEVPLKPREVKYTEMVPEVRTRTAYREVKRKVPVFENKSVTEMVPQIRTRTSYRTETRTVTDKVIKTFMMMAPEVRTKTVYKTKYRDIPQVRTEVYWVDVPQPRKRTVLERVPRRITRNHVQNYTVNVPYQVRRSIPQRVCTMVPKQIVVPIESCCDQCAESFEGLHHASKAFLNFGIEQSGAAWGKILPSPTNRNQAARKED